MRARTFIVFLIATIALLWTGGLALPQSLPAQGLSDQVRGHLRNRVETAGVSPIIAEEPTQATAMLLHFYERRAYQPSWISDDGILPQVDTLIKTIHEADREGLNPNDYHLAKIETTLKEVRQDQEEKKPLNPGTLVDLELLLTDAFLVYGSHLLAGRINPETIDPLWYTSHRQVDLTLVLETALNTNQIEEALKNLLPAQSGYMRLRQALAHYRDIAAKGGWPMVPPGPRMEKGNSSERVLALRARLIASGDLNQEINTDGGLFDDALEQAVRRFQERHGLEADGIVGFATLEALNVPVEERLRQIELNMERWRWIPRDLGERYILVNIPNFELDVVENGRTVMTMRIVVGKPDNRTPVLSSEITHLVLNPSWHVPPRIATKEILPQVRMNSSYLAKHSMKVYQGWGAEAREINPEVINWSQVSAKNLSYRFRQKPGSKNVLGRVKFKFPNPFDVYLHDTSFPELFVKTVRALSHGCIRVEKPIELAEYLLRDDPKWTRERILAAINKRVEQTVWLPEPIPVHLLYWTAWVNEDGSIQFRSDVYGQDNVLDKALNPRDKALALR